MDIWIDAQLPPLLASLLTSQFSVRARHVVELGLERARDAEIFARARDANAVVVTKDSDFVRLLEQNGPPPRVLWMNVGNVNNAELLRIVGAHWLRVIEHFAAGEPLVEIGRSANRDPR